MINPLGLRERKYILYKYHLLHYIHPDTSSMITKSISNAMDKTVHSNATSAFSVRLSMDFPEIDFWLWFIKAIN